MLGAGVDPRLFSYDFAGAYKIGENYAQGISSLGQSIAQGIQGYGEAKEERKKIDAQVKADSASIEAASKLGDSLGIDIRSMLQPIQDVRTDPNTTPMESLELGRSASQAISNALTLGIGAQERQAAMQRSMMDQQLKAAEFGLKEERVNIAKQTAAQGAQPTFDLQKATITSPEGDTFEMDVPYDKKKGMFYDPDAGKYIKDVNKWGFGEPSYAEGEAIPTPTSQVGGNTSDMIATAANINVLPSGSKIPTVSIPYDGRPAPNRFNNPGGAYPRKDLVQFGMEGKGIIGGGHPIAKYPDLVSGAAANMEHFRLLNPVGKTVGQMRKKWVYGMGAKGSLPISGLDENKVITQNDLNDPTFMSKWMSGTAKAEGFKGNLQPDELISAFNLYQAGGYNKNAQSSAADIDASLNMNGDMTQQAIGTPQQQAEIARMIGEGQSMQTAQVTPQGSMGTEPSMATPQPQQAQPQFKPRPGFVATKPQGQQKQVKIVTGDEAKALDLDPLGTYEASYQDGQLTGVQTIKAAPSVGDVIAMEKRQEEQVAKQQVAESVKAKSERMVSLMTELRDHPGFGGLFGVGYTGVPGTESANAKVLYDQIQAQGFMEAIKDMKGMGALSNAEGEKASAAFVGINPSMSEDAALKRIDEVIKYIKEGEKRIQSGNLIETKENKGTGFQEINDYYRNLKKPR